MKRIALFAGACSLLLLWSCNTGHHHEDGHDHDLHHSEEVHGHEGEDPHGHDAAHGHEEEGHAGHSDEIVIDPAKAEAAGIVAETVEPSDFSGVIRTGGQILPAIGDEKNIVATSDGIVSAHGIQEEFGTMVHAALEAAVSGGRAHYDFPQSLSESEKEDLTAALDGIVSGFLASEFYQSRIKGKRTETEIRFYYPMNGGVAEGSADLLVFSDEYNLVVDYKTDRYMDENIHRAQITAYAAAMEDLYGKKCRSVLLYVRGWRAGTMIDRSGAPLSG